MAASTRAGSKRSYQLGIYRAGSRDVRHDRAIGHPRLEVLERRSDRSAVQQRFKPRACLRIRTWRRCKDRPPSPSLDRNSRKTRHDKLRGCVQTMSSIAAGLIFASLRLLRKRPVVGPNAFEVPMPLSNMMSLLPVFRSKTFCSRTRLSVGRKLLASALASSSLVGPFSVADGSPNGSGPSETTVA